jgi:quercetin dioxygenase-like cupin family protein
MKEMLTKHEMIRELKTEFPHVYEWTDKPHTEYPEHTHAGKVSFYVLDGSINMNIDGVHSVVTKGERLNVPVGVSHTAKVGTEGCTFIVGEEIEGDS